MFCFPLSGNWDWGRTGELREEGENEEFTPKYEQKMEPGLVHLKQGTWNANFQLKWIHYQKCPHALVSAIGTGGLLCGYQEEDFVSGLMAYSTNKSHKESL